MGLINLENFLPIIANVKGELMDTKINPKKCEHDALSEALKLKRLSEINEEKFDKFSDTVDKTIKMHNKVMETNEIL